MSPAISPANNEDVSFFDTINTQDFMDILTQLDGDEEVDNDETLQMMVAAEDDFQLGDIRDDQGNSHKDKQSNALKHLNYFLKMYAEQKGDTYVRAEDLTFEPTTESIGWWDDMIGCFFSYLAKHARQQCDNGRERVAYNTATGYASSVKAYYCNKFRKLPTGIPIFEANRWKALRVRLLSNYEEENRQTGKSLVNPHEASTKQDRVAIAIGCMWLNTPRSAQFLHINNTMFQYCGRGSEVSLDRRSRISTTEVIEGPYQYHILQSLLKRQKFGKETHKAIYPHKDSIHQDYYFSLFYRIVMMGDDDDFIFPEFAEKALKQSESKSDSKVSALWSAHFEDLYKSFLCISEVLNHDLHSHCHKKGGNQTMAQIPSVSGLPQIFRSGWEVRGMHSVFDYIVGSVTMEHQAGKALSGWTAKIGELVVGGLPPTVVDITTSPELIVPFIDHLFIKDVNQCWSQ